MRYYIDMWVNYFDFRGKTSRKEYWWAFLIHLLVFAVLAVIVAIVLEYFGMDLYDVLGVYFFATVIPSLSMVIRRFRDAGKHWTALFVVLIPVVGTILYYIFLCQPSVVVEQNNDYGGYETYDYNGLDINMIQTSYPGQYETSAERGRFMQEYFDFWTNYVNFGGRTSRRGYWMAMVYNALACVALLLLGALLEGIDVMYFEEFIGYFLLYLVAQYIPSLSIVARRLRDGGVNLIWVWIYLIIPFPFDMALMTGFLCRPSVGSSYHDYDQSNAARYQGYETYDY